MSSEKWRVAPVEYIAGWCPSYCPTEESARKEKAIAESWSGVEWKIEKVKIEKL